MISCIGDGCTTGGYTKCGIWDVVYTTKQLVSF